MVANLKGAISQERLIAFTSVLKKHGLIKYANKFAQQNKIDYSVYRNKQVDILVRGSIKTYFLFFNFLQNYLKSLPPQEVLIILNFALYEYFFMSTEPFAILNEWVNIAPAKFKKLVNAILRNITREYPKRKLSLESDKVFPEWIQDRILKLPNIKLKQFVKNFLKMPIMFLSIKDPKKINNQVLKDLDIQTISLDNSNYYYSKSSDILNEIKNQNLIFYIQDLAPQIILDRVIGFVPKQKHKYAILDMCSAPGGKAISLFFKLQDKAKFVLTDKNEQRVQRLNQNLDRLGFKPEIIEKADATSKNYPLFVKEKAKEQDGFDLIILDAPCSSLGTIKRHPEILLRFNKELLSKYQKTQLQLLKNAFISTKRGGLILYTVCSFTEEETSLVINYFKAKWNISIEAEEYVYQSTEDISSDIHYYAVLRRN